MDRISGWGVWRLAPRNRNALHLCIKSFMKGGAWKALATTDADEKD